MVDPLAIGMQGSFGLNRGYGYLPFGGRGFLGAAKRVARVKERVAEFLFNAEGTEGLVAAYQDGIVILTGEVATEADQRTIQEGLRKIPGVTGVKMAVRVLAKPAVREAATSRQEPDLSR